MEQQQSVALPLGSVCAELPPESAAARVHAPVCFESQMFLKACIMVIFTKARLTVFKFMRADALLAHLGGRAFTSLHGACRAAWQQLLTKHH